MFSWWRILPYPFYSWRLAYALRGKQTDRMSCISLNKTLRGCSMTCYHLVPRQQVFKQRWLYYWIFFFFLNAVGGLEVKSQFIKSTPSKKLSLRVCNDNICMYTSVQELTASFSLQCTPRNFAYNTTYFRNILTQACQCGWSIATGSGKRSPYL